MGSIGSGGAPDGWAPVYRLSTGRAPVRPDQLYETRPGRWEQPRPVECPRGHQLGAGHVIVGTQSCPAVASGRHITHECRECRAVIYTPPRVAGCDHHGRR
jgi:hypothetical protein